MRIAVISDVHSNVYALRAAIEKLNVYKPDKIVFTGDLVGVGVFPEETVSLAREQQNAVFVVGNHDIFAYTGESPFREGTAKRALFEYQQKVISEDTKEFLRSLPASAIFDADDMKVHCLHYPYVDGRFKDLIYRPTRTELKKLFEGLSGDVFLFGHEHTGSLEEFCGRYYINFGTCGSYLKSNCARCGIVDVRGKKLTYKSIDAYYDDATPKRRQYEVIKNILG